MSKVNSPLVTVYITNYNYEAYLERSIQSVLDQDIQDFELIIIDDGSTDNSKEIIERYREYDGISIVYQQNKGLNATNNVALRMAKGKYIMRLDSDDFLESDALDSMCGVLESDESLGLVFPDYYFVDKEDRRIGGHIRHDFKNEVSLLDQPAHGACTMIRLSVLKNLGGYDEEFTCQDGYDLWLKFITYSKITNINKPLFSYRRHGNNLTSDENRILSSRRMIKAKFASKNYNLPKTLAIIPVRDDLIGIKRWSTFKIDNKSVLSLKINECLNSESLTHVAVVSSNLMILNHVRNLFPSVSVSTVLRPSSLETLDKTLLETTNYVLEKIKPKDFECVMSISLDYPLLNPGCLDEMIHTKVIFNANSVISVRATNNSYYSHNGRSMIKIYPKDDFSRLEREEIYFSSGGLILTETNALRSTNKMISGVVSHVLIDNRSSFKVSDNYSLEFVSKNYNEIPSR